MTLRTLTAAAAVTLALGGVTGCRSNVGNAATVGGHRISESEVSSYLTPQGAAPSLISAAQSRGQAFAPRTLVLQTLVQEQVFTKTLAKNGGVPAPGSLTGSHDAAAQLLLRSAGGSALDRALASGLPERGIRASFAATYLRALELEYALISRKRLPDPAHLTALVRQARLPVSVSPRYGKWDAASLSLNASPTAALPAFVSLQPQPSAGSDSITSTP